MRSASQVPESEGPDFDTIVLAGGKAARMDGADKPALEVGGVSMIVLVARTAAAAGTRSIVVVGPERDGTVQAGLADVAGRLPGGLVLVREEPPGAGPVAALRRGLAEVTAPWVALLAADLPFLAGWHLADVLAAGVSAGTAGVVLADHDGRPQWLAGAWQVGRLAQGLAAYGGSSLGGLLAPLCPKVLRLPEADARRPPWLDCDTPQDLAAARAGLPVGADCPARAVSADRADFRNGAP